MLNILLAATVLASVPPQGEPLEKPFRRGELIFAPQARHNHGSCLVECPNGDLLACWYRGSGEAQSDDVAIVGARRREGDPHWSEVFAMADTPGFPDCNPCMIIDVQKTLRLFWPVILDNQWESALLMSKTSNDYVRNPGPPQWQTEKVIHLKPGPEFAEAVRRDLDRQWEPGLKAASGEVRQRLQQSLATWHRRSNEKLSVRLGWMPRAHPVQFDGNRLILPLYSDGFAFSIMAYTDDGGATWNISAPLVGAGSIQPSIARRRDGTLVAFFRDGGPPPKRVLVSESGDKGLTWSLARDTDRPNPGAGLEVIVLKSGRWALINNDTEKGRHSLAVSVSEDEGCTWPIVRHLEHDAPGQDTGSYSYPSILQARDGTLHATYSYEPNPANVVREGKGESIKHVQFNEAWLLEGRPTP
ncbi:MAG TPA: exo-alpha-sialidase [Verrucomicrobiota bacterium]|nr:exo-alpha-sialidase [Verrucomicrobiota bacterium]